MKLNNINFPIFSACQESLYEKWAFKPEKYPLAVEHKGSPLMIPVAYRYLISNNCWPQLSYMVKICLENNNEYKTSEERIWARCHFMYANLYREGQVISLAGQEYPQVSIEKNFQRDFEENVDFICRFKNKEIGIEVLHKKNHQETNDFHLKRKSLKTAKDLKIRRLVSIRSFDENKNRIDRLSEEKIKEIFEELINA